MPREQAYANVLYRVFAALERHRGEKPNRVDKSFNPRYTQNMKFGLLLRKLRAESGLGIKTLAPELGVTYTYLSKLENGGARPSEDFVERVSSYFNYSSAELLPRRVTYHQTF